MGKSKKSRDGIRIESRKASKRSLSRNRSKKFLEFKDLQKISKKFKKEGKKIVFTIGSFDLINPGHCRYLADAKSAGDVLVVGISSDISDHRIKGDKYPLLPENIRAELVSYFRSVDYVTLVDNDRPHAALVMLQPDTFFTSENDWKSGLRNSQDQIVLDMYGGGVYRDPIYEPYYRISDLVGEIADIRFTQILQRYLHSKFENLHFNFSGTLSPVDFGLQKPRNLFAFNAGDLIVEPSSLKDLRVESERNDRKVVFVSGSYDLLHVGHVRFIEKAALHGDFLVVGIPSDEAVKKLKGIGRPVISETSRAYVLASLDVVDRVVIFPDVDVLKSLQNLRPSVFYTVKDSWNKGYKESPEYKFVTEYGGKVIRGPKQASSISASAIIDKLAYEKVQDIFKDCMRKDLYEDILNERSRLNGK